MSRRVGARVAVMVEQGRTESAVPAVPTGRAPAQVLRFSCPKCAAPLETRADLRRVRHVLLRCGCGGFQRVALAEVA